MTFLVTGDFYTEAEMETVLKLDPCLRSKEVYMLGYESFVMLHLRQRRKEIKQFGEANPSLKRWGMW